MVKAETKADSGVGESSIVERILVADDDKDVLTALELLLDREQMEALLVGSPAEAVDAVKTNSFAASSILQSITTLTAAWRKNSSACCGSRCVKKEPMVSRP